MRLIDADELIDSWCRECNAHCLKKYDFRCKGVRDIMDMPTVEAETVRRGEWIPSESNTATKTTKIFSCSKCEEIIELGRYAYKYYYNYCPHCGAKMDL